MLKKTPFILLVILVCSCATYYEINSEFNQSFEAGNLEAAEKTLDANKKAAKGKARFLYYANQGVIHSMMGNLGESNQWLEKAYLFGEDYQKNAGNITASFLLNPNTIVYPGEDHEQLLLLYYKVLNLVKMKDYESALIECRRLNNRLNELSDQYKSDNKYKRDAFINNLMGIIFDASGDYNNAFIAYRNAYTIYEEDYEKIFGLAAPLQLKKDLIRTASLTGFYDQVDFYKRKFGLYKVPEKPKEELIFFWHNGLGPVKDEWSINFTAVDNGPGMVVFENAEYGFSFPFPVGSDQKGELTDLRVFRIAFPKYVERKPYFDKASILIGDQQFILEKAEPVNAIAIKTLEERMLEELGKGLLRAAIKKSMEAAVRGDFSSAKDKSAEEKKEEELREGLALVLGLFNAITEKADTRNWQTIPHDIHYTRVPLDSGHNEVTLKTTNSTFGASSSETFYFNLAPGETVFHAYQSLEIRR